MFPAPGNQNRHTRDISITEGWSPGTDANRLSDTRGCTGGAVGREEVLQLLRSPQWLLLQHPRPLGGSLLPSLQALTTGPGVVEVSSTVSPCTWALRVPSTPGLRSVGAVPALPTVISPDGQHDEDWISLGPLPTDTHLGWLGCPCKCVQHPHTHQHVRGDAQQGEGRAPPSTAPCFFQRPFLFASFHVY